MGLEEKTIAYVKDKGSNLSNMTTTFKTIMKCEVLSLDESFQGTCFDHFFYRVCQYAIIDEKVYRNFIFVSIESLLNHICRNV
jgi:hypothetical protein